MLRIPGRACLFAVKEACLCRGFRPFPKKVAFIHYKGSVYAKRSGIMFPVEEMGTSIDATVFSFILGNKTAILFTTG